MPTLIDISLSGLRSTLASGLLLTTLKVDHSRSLRLLRSMTAPVSSIFDLCISKHINCSFVYHTALTPFWNAQTTFWASAGTQDTSSLGYTYPDFNGLDLGNTEAVQTAIANRVNELYGSFFFSSSEASFAGESEAQVPQVAQQVAPPNVGLYDWTARIEFKKNELGRSFTVLLFLGEVPDDLNDWQLSANFVGAFHAFVNSSADRCANCRAQQEIVVEGFVHLNKGILEKSGLNSLEPSVVEPYLARNLHWRVQKVLFFVSNYKKGCYKTGFFFFPFRLMEKSPIWILSK